MRNLVLASLISFGLPAAAVAQSQPFSPFNPQTGWAVASNTVFGSNGWPLAFNAAYDPATSVAANYIMSQQGSNDTFGPLVHVPGATEQWTETTAPDNWMTAGISFASNSYIENVAENSSLLACTRNGNSAEYDLLLSPNGYDSGTNVVTAASATYKSNPTSFPSLAQLASLTVSGVVTINSLAQPVTLAACAQNHASVGFFFALVDRKTNQHLSYSLHLGALCYPGTDYLICTSQPRNAAIWYEAGNVPAVTDTPFGLTSGLSIVPNGGSPINLPLTTPGTVTFNSLDFLARIEALIRVNPYNLDTNPADWQVTGLSYGTSIWGDSYLNTSWRGLNATVVCRNAGCS